MQSYYVRLVRKDVTLDDKIHIVRGHAQRMYNKPWKAPMQAVCGLSRGGGYHAGGWKIAAKRNARTEGLNLCEACRVLNVLEDLKFESA